MSPDERTGSVEAYFQLCGRETMIRRARMLVVRRTRLPQGSAGPSTNCVVACAAKMVDLTDAQILDAG